MVVLVYETVALAVLVAAIEPFFPTVDIPVVAIVDLCVVVVIESHPLHVLAHSSIDLAHSPSDRMNSH